MTVVAACTWTPPQNAGSHSIVYEGLTAPLDPDHEPAGFVRVDEDPPQPVAWGSVIAQGAYRVVRISEDSLDLSGPVYECKGREWVSTRRVTLKKHQRIQVAVPCKPDWPTTVAEAAERAIEMLSEDQRRTIRDTPRSELHNYHHTLGGAIRNNFGLWSGNRALRASAGPLDLPVDDVSMLIMEAAWERLQERR